MPDEVIYRSKIRVDRIKGPTGARTCLSRKPRFSSQPTPKLQNITNTSRASIRYSQRPSTMW